MQTLPDIESWLNQAPNRELSNDYRDLSNELVARALRHLGLHQLRPITIAGTKGKGSTQAFLASILHAHGREVVTFSSPHVLDLRERWGLNTGLFPDVELSSAANTVARAENDLDAQLTYFERCFLMACVLAGAHPQAEFILEVGIGGRLDCANALDTRLAILTRLDLDHTELLGETLTKIAAEKLGIARADAPLLVSEQSPEGRAAIDGQVPPNADLERVDATAVLGPLGIPGDHQCHNAATALSAAHRLLGDEYRREAADAGLAKAFLPGRCQLVERGGQRMLIDGAHTAASVAATLAYADDVLRPGWVLILGSAADKEIGPILDLIPPSRRVIRCGYANPRARTEADWPETARQYPWAEDVSAALALVGTELDCCIGGSFYLAGEALTLIQGVGAMTAGEQEL